MKSQAFTTAGAPPAPACKQPQSVSNIRSTAGSVQGSKATMVSACLWAEAGALLVTEGGSSSLIKGCGQRLDVAARHTVHEAPVTTWLLAGKEAPSCLACRL